MITPVDLRIIADARLEDARVLLASQRYDGAVYIGGYAIELVLKARICDTLGWQGFPETKGEFAGLGSFKVHDLEMLLHLTGREAALKQSYWADWSIVTRWNPEARYKLTGQVTPKDAQDFLRSTGILLQHI